MRALVAARRARGAGEVQAEVAHRPHERVVLEHRSVLLQRLLELGGPIRRAQAAPGDEVGAGGDRRGRVDLQEGQPLHDGQELGRPRRVEQLRPHRDAPGLRLGEPVHGPEATSGVGSSLHAQDSPSVEGSGRSRDRPLPSNDQPSRGVTNSGHTSAPGVRPPTGTAASGSTSGAGSWTVGSDLDDPGPPAMRRISTPRLMSNR